MKLFVNRSVEWNDGSQDRQGKVKQIIGDHVVIEASSGEQYIVARSAFEKKTAQPSSLTIVATRNKE